MVILLLLSLLSLSLSLEEYIHNFISSRNNNFNLKLYFYDNGYKNSLIYETTSFRLKIYNNNKFIDSNNIHIHGRLISNTVIIPLNIKYNIDINDNKTYYYYCNYKIYDIESYKLQLRISWLYGGLLDPLFDIYNNIKNVSNDIFLKYSKHVDEIIFDNNISLNLSNNNNNNNNNNNKLIKPNCTDGDINGRWVKIPDGKDCPNHWCIGNNEDIKWLDDKMYFNMGRFIYSPYKCNYVIYNRQNIHQCFKTKGITKLSFTGDSLIREFYQNIYVLLSASSSENIKLQKVKKAHKLDFNIYQTNYTIHLEYYVDGREWKESIKNTDIHLINVAIHRLSVSNTPEKYLINKCLSSLQQDIVRLEKNKKNNSTFLYYNQPAIQREDPRVDRKILEISPNNSKIVSPFAAMTRNRQEIMSKGLLQYIRRRNINIIDGLLISDVRWESTWDGIHYRSSFFLFLFLFLFWR